MNRPTQKYSRPLGLNDSIRSFTRPALARLLLIPFLWITVLGVDSASLLRADDTMVIPPGNYTHQLGDGSLADPLGAAHTRRDATGRVIVAIFSIPNMSQGGYQEKWANLLAHQSDTQLPNSVFLVLFENMSQAGMFKGIARSDLKKQFTKGSRPLVVLDETGSIFRKYGVPSDKTEILVYDKTGALVDVEQDLSDTNATVHRLHAITRKLQQK